MSQVDHVQKAVDEFLVQIKGVLLDLHSPKIVSFEEKRPEKYSMGTKTVRLQLNDNETLSVALWTTGSVS